MSQPTPTPQRFSPLATFLHAFSLIVSLILVCFLSYLILNRTLTQQIPTQATGWIEAEGKQYFTLDPVEAQQAAELIDAGEYVRTDKATAKDIQGELTFTVVSKKTIHFQLNAAGVYKSEGFYRQIALDAAASQALRTILLKASGKPDTATAK